MIFLNEKWTAVLFGILCFFVSAAVGISQGNALSVVLTRALLLSLVALSVGFIFGWVLKEIFLETLVAINKAEEAKRKAAKNKKEALKAASISKETNS